MENGYCEKFKNYHLWITIYVISKTLEKQVMLITKKIPTTELELQVFLNFGRFIHGRSGSAWMER